MTWEVCHHWFFFGLPSNMLGAFRAAFSAMANDGKQPKEVGSGPSDSTEDDQSWSQVVPGFHRGATWTSHRISEKELEQLQRFFSRVLEIPHAEVEESRRQWEGRSIFVRSLGHRISARMLARDFKLKLKLEEEPEVFPLAEDHFTLCFKFEGECALARSSGSWIVAEQLLAMEQWRPNFIPSRQPI